MVRIDAATLDLLEVLGTGVLSIGAIAVMAREWFKSRALTDSNRDAAINGVEINQGVLRNIQDELKRHSERIKELESRVEELTGKLANVRLVALDCVALVNECTCSENARDRLLTHLRQIIRDS